MAKERQKSQEELALEENIAALQKSVEARTAQLKTASGLPRSSQNGDTEKEAITRSIEKEKARIAEMQARLSELNGTQSPATITDK